MRPYPVLLLISTACAPKLVLPPIPTGPEWGAPLEVPPVEVSPASSDAPNVRVETDVRTGYLRYAVTTHPGVYVAWMHKPQLTFFAVQAASGPPTRPPGQVGLVFRTLEPQAVMAPFLVLTCGALQDSIGLATASHVVPTGNTHSHFLTYRLPVPRLTTFATCAQGVLAIGDIRVPFGPPELGGLRRLLVRIGAATWRRAT